MANLRDIKKRISSISSTMQITRTMEMVSTAKIRRALDRARRAEPYKKALTDVMLTVAQDAQSAGNNALMRPRESVKRGLVVAVASDRGLAGGFNVGVVRSVEQIMSDWGRRGIDTEIITCGRKPSEYFGSRADVVMNFTGSSADPTLEQARMIASYICDGYASEQIDQVEVVYHHARNRVVQQLRCERLLPLDPEMLAMAHGPRKNANEGPKRLQASFTFVPSAERVLGELIPSYVLTVVHQALIDSAAAEQGARRTAMHSATENATAIISTLSHTYNRVRQASITTEINEIVGGASALEEQQ
ncbi:ATP synthase F1 subcomplex gamma subunit [Coriobacterium glomerans PW2]|uniref:ATP synthase gamma chain n=1 Tax=Coriobacterium glomerans (strain ATCC 49209 / DSM 20642 / JCM 10262 / PW2) TaxID=700015 RepID=F2NAD0_CORGP|nr:ATP synthase F1 subunit gamma [Coriobacterium glomerans]AEB06316.1 ATP synthase F1 subcomplex gamma subunit [Coriobacterium glomerans PW2]